MVNEQETRRETIAGHADLTGSDIAVLGDPPSPRQLADGMNRARSRDRLQIASAGVEGIVSAVILLGGGVAASSLQRATGRSTVELSLGTGPAHSISQLWLSEIADLHAQECVRVGESQKHAGSPAGISGRILVRHAVVPGIEVPQFVQRGGGLGAAHEVRIQTEIVRDRGELRGAGGALRDAVADLSPDAVVLVAPAGQVLLRGLCEIVQVLRTRQADVALSANTDGTPGSVMLARVEALMAIPSVGYMDLKEQALPLISRRWTVRAHRFSPPAAMSVRTAAEYLAALRLLGSAARPERDNTEYGEDAWSLVEPGAEVAASALLLGSVVLATPGRPSRVGAGAVLVRTLVCPGGVVAPGEMLVDKVVVGGDRVSASRAPSDAVADRIGRRGAV